MLRRSPDLVVLAAARQRAQRGRRLAAWPSALSRFLDGSTRLSLVAHVSGVTLYDEEVGLGSGAGRIAVVSPEGKPLGLDKSNRLSQTFDSRSPEQVAPLLDSIQQVLDAIRDAGVEAFLAYGTLLGAVRQGGLIGHDSDADLGYVSRHSHPVDVILESFRLQRHTHRTGLSTPTATAGSPSRSTWSRATASVAGSTCSAGSSPSAVRW